MIEDAAAYQSSPPGLADRLEELADLLQEVLTSGQDAGQLMAIRRRIQKLQAESEEIAGVGASRALGRIGLLTEVWECLSAGEPGLAGEIGLFCVKATLPACPG